MNIASAAAHLLFSVVVGGAPRHGSDSELVTTRPIVEKRGRGGVQPGGGRQAPLDISFQVLLLALHCILSAGCILSAVFYQL
jgi:hypothetical protein